MDRRGVSRRGNGISASIAGPGSCPPGGGGGDTRAGRSALRFYTRYGAAVRARATATLRAGVDAASGQRIRSGSGRPRTPAAQGRLSVAAGAVADVPVGTPRSRMHRHIGIKIGAYRGCRMGLRIVARGWAAWLDPERGGVFPASSLIARFASLPGDKNFPAGLRWEKVRNSLIGLEFL